MAKATLDPSYPPRLTPCPASSLSNTLLHPLRSSLHSTMAVSATITFHHGPPLPTPHPAAWRQGLGTKSSPAALGGTPTPQKAPRNPPAIWPPPSAAAAWAPSRWPRRGVTHSCLRPGRQLFPLPATRGAPPEGPSSSHGTSHHLTIPGLPTGFPRALAPTPAGCSLSAGTAARRDSRGLQAGFAGPSKCPRGPGPSARGRLPGAPRRARRTRSPSPRPRERAAAGGAPTHLGPGAPGRDPPAGSARPAMRGRRNISARSHCGAGRRPRGWGGPGSWVLSPGSAGTPRRVPSPGSIPSTPPAAQRPAPTPSCCDPRGLALEPPCLPQSRGTQKTVTCLLLWSQLFTLFQTRAGQAWEDLQRELSGAFSSGCTSPLRSAMSGHYALGFRRSMEGSK